MKTSIKIGLSLGMLLLLATAAAGQAVNSDSWAATDALGRKVREYKDAGDKKKDKFVGIFYLTWHMGRNDTTSQVKKHHRNRPAAPRSDERLQPSGLGNFQTGHLLLGRTVVRILQDDRPVGVAQTRRNAGRRRNRRRFLRLHQRDADLFGFVRSADENLGSSAERRRKGA